MSLSESSTSLTLEIPRHLKDTRVDSAVATLLHEKYPAETALSRSFLARAIKEGGVLVNGARVLPRSLVATHDVITIRGDIFATKQTLQPAYSDIAVKVLYENERILVLDKGAGVQMHRGGIQNGITVAEWLLGHYPVVCGVGEDPMRPGIVHRLDRDTSGVVVIAKDNESFRVLKGLFQGRLIEKKYIALVYGHLDTLVGKIETSLMRRSGDLKRCAVDPQRLTGMLPGNTRTALTWYRVLARYEAYDLVELTPKTGRTHQIRVHLASLGHAVVGDRLYASKLPKRSKLLMPQRHLLHARELSFELFGEQYHFHAPVPPDFQQVLMDLDETRVSSYDDEALKTCLPPSAE